MVFQFSAGKEVVVFFVASANSENFKGLCHLRRMHALMRSTSKSLAQLFQIPLFLSV